MHKPLVSIGVPTYNRPVGLRTALEHIFKQTYINFEIIISDNNSSAQFEKEYKEILNTFNDGRVKYFKQEKNIGPHANFSFVLNQAQGEYFILAADDDMMLSDNLIERLVGQIQQGYQLVFSNFTVHGKESEHLTKVYGQATDRFSYLKAWCTDLIGFPMYGLFDRKYLIDNKYNDVLDTPYYYIDSIFLHRFFLNANVCYVPDVYILYAKSNSFSTFSIFFMIKSFLRMIKISIPYFYKSNLSIKQHFIIARLLIPNYIMYLSRLSVSLVVRLILSVFGYAIKRDDNNKLRVIKDIKMPKVKPA